jgi:hypothetical protein
MRLATSLLCSLLAVGCVDSESDPLAGLDPYASDSGGSKADGDCTDATYRAFVVPYVKSVATSTLDQLKTAADANPCKAGNDASYRIWSYLAKQQLDPLDERYFDAIQQRQNGQATADQVTAAGKMDQSARTMLQALALVRPAGAGKVGMGAWMNDLYQPALQTTTIAVGTLVFSGTGPDQLPREITADEQEWLGFVEAAQPKLVEANGWAIWWEVAGPTADDVHNNHAGATQAQLDIDAAWLTRLAQEAPKSSFDVDGAAFQNAVTQSISDDFTSSVPQPELWKAELAIAPGAGGPLSYKAWASQFAENAQSFNDSTPSASAVALMADIVAAKPCAAGPDVDMLVTKLKNGLASAGDDGSGHALADDVTPAACVQPTP